MQTFSTGQGCAAGMTRLKSLILHYGDEGENILGEAAHGKLVVVVRRGERLFGKVVKA